jgi:hypothetical protein
MRSVGDRRRLSLFPSFSEGRCEGKRAKKAPCRAQLRERGRVVAKAGLGFVFFVVASAFCFLCNQALVELGMLKNRLCYFYVNRFLQLLFGWRISPGFCSLCMLCGPSPFSSVVPLLCVCVRVLFFSGCCFFGPLHDSITELLVLLPPFCCCTRRSFFLAESG